MWGKISSEIGAGDGIIVNADNSIDHDCVTGDHCHVAVGLHVCGSFRNGR